MKISVVNGDYGWDVWLEGVKLKNVVMADDELGQVEVLVEPSLQNGWPIGRQTLYGKVEIQRSEPKGTPKPANVQGLVAPVWSDSGGVTYTVTIDEAMWPWSGGGVRVKPSYSFEGIQWPTFDFAPPKVSTAKDAIPALTRVSGNKRGPGWCDE